MFSKTISVALLASSALVAAMPAPAPGGGLFGGMPGLGNMLSGLGNKYGGAPEAQGGAPGGGLDAILPHLMDKLGGMQGLQGLLSKIDPEALKSLAADADANGPDVVTADALSECGVPQQAIDELAPLKDELLGYANNNEGALEKVADDIAPMCGGGAAGGAAGGAGGADDCPYADGAGPAGGNSPAGGAGGADDCPFDDADAGVNGGADDDCDAGADGMGDHDDDDCDADAGVNGGADDDCDADGADGMGDHDDDDCDADAGVNGGADDTDCPYDNDDGAGQSGGNSPAGAGAGAPDCPYA